MARARALVVSQLCLVPLCFPCLPYPRTLTHQGCASRDTGEVSELCARDVLFRSPLRYCTLCSAPQTALSGCASRRSYTLVTSARPRTRIAQHRTVWPDDRVGPVLRLTPRAVRIVEVEGPRLGESGNDSDVLEESNKRAVLGEGDALGGKLFDGRRGSDELAFGYDDDAY